MYKKAEIFNSYNKAIHIYKYIYIISKTEKKYFVQNMYILRFWEALENYISSSPKSQRTVLLKRVQTHSDSWSYEWFTSVDFHGTLLWLYFMSNCHNNLSCSFLLFSRIYCLDNCKPRASISRKFIAKVSVNCSSQVEFYGIVENLYFFQHHEKALPTSSRSVHFGNFQSNNALLYLNVVWSHDLPLITENLHLIAMVYHWCLHMSFWIGSFDWLISGPIRLNFNTDQL